MKNAEKVLGALVLVGLLMKYFGIPFNGVISLLSLTVLAMLYYPLGFLLLNGIRLRNSFQKLSYEKTNWKKIATAAFAGIGLSTLLIGILFKVQLWPSADFMLRAGISISLVGAIIALVFYPKSEPTFSKRLLSRVTIWGALGLALLFVSDEALIDHIFVDRSDEYREIMKELQMDPGNQELQDKLNELDEKYYESESD